MQNDDIKQALEQSGGTVPKLDMLNQQEAMSVLAFHVRNCDQHAEILNATPTIQIQLDNEQLACKVCGCTERFQIPAHHATSLAEYLCRILRQGAKFDRLHFETCAQTEGSQQ